MRHRFRESYVPTDAELKQAWATGTVVIDSNVLLGLYQYSPSTLEEFFKVLSAIKERLWLPHQAGLEFQRNRVGSLPQQRGILERLIQSVEDIDRSLGSLGLPEHHPVLDLDAIEASRNGVHDSIEVLLEQIRAALQATPEFKVGALLGAEELRDRLTLLYEGRVGEPFGEEQLQAMHKTGAARYEKETPPGYKDRTKDERSRYGDFILWKQILDHQKGVQNGPKDVLFVTNDRKEDWWLRREAELLGPRPELVREYLNEVGGLFCMYTPAEFLRASPRYLPLEISSEAIADVKRVSAHSPVVAHLRSHRMVLPDAGSRVRCLAQIFDSLSAGLVRRAGDLNSVIEGLGDLAATNTVAAPLFFSLVNETYGPIEVKPEPGGRLRDRLVGFREAATTKETFVRAGHLAWLAQALYRIRNGGFSDEELLVALFGEDYSQEAPILLDAAKAMADVDFAYRAGA